MTANWIYMGLILVYGFIGLWKGLIRSLGGLLSMIVSGLLAKALAIPVTKLIFELTGLENRIESALSIIQGSIMPVDCYQSIFLLFNITAVNLASIITMIVLFTIFMFICGFFVNRLNDVFLLIPFGKTINKAGGFICGAIKGLIVVVIISYIFLIINRLLGTGMPVNSSIYTVLLQRLSILQFIQ